VRNTHHDAIELADGRIIKLVLLNEGQRARVLQLPARPGERPRHAQHQVPASAAGSGPGNATLAR
jgi:hypothetical protein